MNPAAVLAVCSQITLLAAVADADADRFGSLGQNGRCTTPPSTSHLRVSQVAEQGVGFLRRSIAVLARATVLGNPSFTIHLHYAFPNTPREAMDASEQSMH